MQNKAKEEKKLLSQLVFMMRRMANEQKLGRKSMLIQTLNKKRLNSMAHVKPIQDVFSWHKGKLG
jgi:hypothetical protein